MGGVLFLGILAGFLGRSPEWVRFGNFAWGLGVPGLVGVCRLCPALSF